jgi:hypothetical protein
MDTNLQSKHNEIFSLYNQILNQTLGSISQPAQLVSCKRVNGTISEHGSGCGQNARCEQCAAPHRRD